MKKKSFILVCVAIIFEFCYSQPSPSVSQNSTQNSYSESAPLNQNRTLIPGDQISYAVLEDANAGLSVAPVTLTVKSDGTITIPIQGPRGLEFTIPPIRAQGLTPLELQKNIKSILEKDYYNTATVSLNLISFGGSIEIMGEVGSPGTYDLPPDRRLTITAAIARAGGFTQFANQRKVELRRRLPDGNMEKKTIDVRQIQKTGKGNIELQHGDEINVRPVGIFPD